MNNADWAWAAGVIEGEGCLTIVHRKRRAASEVAVRVQMTDADVVRQLQARTTFGRVSGPYAQKGKGYKPFWCWQVCRRDDLQILLRNIRPWLGGRRGSKADAMLQELAHKRARRVLQTASQRRATKRQYYLTNKARIDAYQRDWQRRKRRQTKEDSCVLQSAA